MPYIAAKGSWLLSVLQDGPQHRLPADSFNSADIHTKDNHYRLSSESMRLSFGWRNTGASFQCHMDNARVEVKAAFAFVDDVLVFSENHAAHCIHLCQLFATLQRHNLVIHEEKRVFGASTMDVLGFRVSASGVYSLYQRRWQLCRSSHG